MKKLTAWFFLVIVGMLALVLSAVPASAAGGPVFLSGDDADDSGHCGGTACGGLYPTAMSFVHNNSTSVGTGIVAIGINSGNALSSFNSWNSVANGGPGAVVTPCNTTGPAGCIQTVNFADFKMIYIASNDNNTDGGLTADQLADLNLRQADIVNFVNNLGGGLMALTEAGDGAQYNWLPLSLNTADVDHFGPDIFPTLEMAKIAPGITSADLNHGCCYHTVFTGPPGFSGLKVLAFHDHNGNQQFDGEAVDHVLILGGAEVIIQGTIELSPATSTNPVGTNHTVTAFAEDGEPLAPAVGVTVTFTVTSGPNAGASGTCTVNADCTTDANGNVSFTYTGSGGAGTDVIMAEFVDAGGNTQADTAEKTWTKPDDFLCYKVKSTTGSICTQDAAINAGGSCDVEEDCGGIEEITSLCVPNKFPRGLQVSLLDQFEDKDFDVKKPISLCNPAEKDGGSVNDPDTHLKGYKIKEVKNSCTIDAPQNAGRVCRTEEDCGGVTEVTEFCEETPKHERRANIKVDNQFGTIFVDTKKPERLLVPTAKSLTDPVDAPDLAAINVDHFKCYEVNTKKKICEDDPTVQCKTDEDCTEAGLTGSCNLGFPKGLQVSLVDQFDQPKLYDVKKPRRLCTPVDKNGEGIKTPETHLMCYQVKPVEGVCAVGSPQNTGGACKKEEDCGGTKDVTTFCERQLKHEKVPRIFVNNQFGPEQLDTIKEEELCVPSVKTLAP